LSVPESQSVAARAASRPGSIQPLVLGTQALVLGTRLLVLGMVWPAPVRGVWPARGRSVADFRARPGLGSVASLPRCDFSAASALRE